ncbi:hypothetical protein PCANC_23738 [Puccinia coronata f. sp. avenae]|uniref:Uncharacterized protein n=1 Tax=Puccinia coronata f. sp. avenae TaxID=200324 RepID=A0A2N5SC23_9BASI|nr:hypothetical protein PCANC_23738 [Puccinia coronata f. sp. avenae]
MDRSPRAMASTCAFAICKKHFLRYCSNTGRAYFHYPSVMYFENLTGTEPRTEDVSLRAFSHDDDGLMEDHVYIITGHWLMTSEPNEVPIFQFSMGDAHGLALTSRCASYTGPLTTVFTFGTVQSATANYPEFASIACPVLTFTLDHEDYNKKNFSVTAFAVEYHLEFNAVLPCVAIGDEITVEGRVYDYTPATKRFHIKVASFRVEGTSRMDVPRDSPLA